LLHKSKNYFHPMNTVAANFSLRYNMYHI